MLGAPLISTGWGGDWAARLAALGARVVVNGGNCFCGDVNWVHHVHASDPHDPKGGPLRRLKGRIDYRNWLREERKAVNMARLVVTTCERNRRDLVERLGVDDRRIRTAYYGIDPSVFRPAADDERAATPPTGSACPRAAPWSRSSAALGDRRKGFDTLFAAWKRALRVPLLGRRPDRGGLRGRAAVLEGEGRRGRRPGRPHPLPGLPPRRARDLPGLRRPLPALALRGLFAW